MTLGAATFQVPGDFATIQEALDAATNGDTILVAPGVHEGSIDFSGKDVELRSTEGPDGTVIQGDGGTTVRIGPLGQIIGFSITEGAASFGAGMDAEGTGTLIEGNIFRSNIQGAGGFGAGIGGNGASPTIRGNVFRQNLCDSQFTSGVVSFVNDSSPWIVNNIFADNPCRAINIHLPGGNQPKVINNTIVRNPAGIRIDRRVSAATEIYRNNVLVDNQIGLEVDFGDEANNPVWENNLVFGNGVDYEGIASQTGVSGNISEDPLFFDPPNGDFHLTSGSPAVDSGASTDAPDTDFEGNPRPIDGDGDGVAVVDMGAFEFRGFFRGFSDDPLIAGVSVIRATHFTELRTRIDAQRVARGLPAFAWTDDPLTVGTTVIKAVHLTELRSALDQAYVAAGMATPTYTDPSLGVGTAIKAIHVMELRGFVIALE